MANPCGPSHLPSQPDPTYADVTVFGAIALTSYLNNKGLGWVLQYGIPALIGTAVYDLPSFCQADPPVLSCPTASDVFNWFNPLNPQGAAQLRDAMLNLVSAYLWYDLCRCSDGSKPTVPAPCTAPTGSTINPPTLSVPPLPSACVNNNQPSTGLFTSPINETVFSAATIAAFPSLQSVEFDLVVTGLTQTTTVSLIWKTPGGATLSSLLAGTIAAGGSGFTQRIGVPYGAGELDVQFSWSGGSQGAARFTWTAGGFCGALAGVPSQPCCPPDENQQAMLSQILHQLEALYKQLIVYPNSIVTSTVTHGVTGNGSVILQPDTTGVATFLTTIPARAGRESGSDIRYWDIGHITYYNGSGTTSLGPIEFDIQHWVIPPGAGTFRTFNYSLTPGTVMDIYERKLY